MVHHFRAGQIVRFTEDAKRIFLGSKGKPKKYYENKHIVLETYPIPQTNMDPMSIDYMGEMEGQKAVGHHQQVRFVGEPDDERTSGALIEPA